MNSSDLDVILVCDGLELCFVVHQLWKVDMDGCSQGGTEVSWARCDISEVVVPGELGNFFDGTSCS